MGRRFFSPWHGGRVLAWLALFFGPLGAAQPDSVTVTTPTRLEIVAQGKPGGSVGLRGGESLTLVGVQGDFAVVRYRNLSGRVLAAHTDLPPMTASTAPEPGPSSPLSAAASAPASAAPVPVVASPPPPARLDSYVPVSTVERLLAGKLVAWDGGALRRQEPARLAGVKFFGLYFSAGWCGPCRQFTPELIDAYGKIRALYPEFEIVLVNRDKSPAEMAAYVRDDHMPWPALEWSAIRGAPEILRYAGSGIPCLVLIDGEGKVLSDSYRWGRYVGPDAVLADTWKILREYRRQQPRAK